MKVVKSTCGLCFAGCGVRIYIKDGKPIKIEGNPESPVNRGIVCEKAMASFELLYHPERLRHPLMRTGRRGGGNWKRIPWDEAIGIVGERLISIKDKWGAEAVAFIHGAAKGLQDTYLKRFANVFGSPNVAPQGHVCFLPRKFGSVTTFGYYPCADYDYPPSCIVVWGSNKAKIAEYHKTLEAQKKGARLIVIDPRMTELSKRASEWVRLRPGSDCALALGMIHVIIHESLYDKAFVEKWTIGFDELKMHVKTYTPERVEKIAWVDRELIRNIARIYATTRPACIQMGNAFEHTINSFQTVRAISILKGLTGNLSVPGGEIFRKPLPIPERYAPELSLDHMLPLEKKTLRLGVAHQFPLLNQYAHPPSVIKAMREGLPYPVRMAYIQGANPLLTYPDAQEVYKAFTGLEFLAVAELFMTPTAALADIVLPSASYLEFDSIVNPPYYPVAQIQQKVAQVDECWSDFKILNKLSKKIGMEAYFWEDEIAFLDLILKPAGMDFDQFRERVFLSGQASCHHYEEKGFNTRSGKVEFFSTPLQELGLDPLPTYYELRESALGDPELTKEYPLTLTSWKSEYYRHSGQRQIQPLRNRHPEPVAYIHPHTAVDLGIHEGDWVWIATKRGRIRQKAVLSDAMDPRVVGVDYAWWFPEKGPGDLYGWRESNINLITNQGPPYAAELGTPNLRGILCKIDKDTGDA